GYAGFALSAVQSIDFRIVDAHVVAGHRDHRFNAALFLQTVRFDLSFERKHARHFDHRPLAARGKSIEHSRIEEQLFALLKTPRGDLNRAGGIELTAVIGVASIRPLKSALFLIILLQRKRTDADNGGECDSQTENRPNRSR